MARTTTVWGAYLFKDKDPAIDGARTLLRDALGGLTRKHLAIVEANGGPVVATLEAWFSGDTLKPQNPSMEACGRAVGYQRVWKKMERDAYEKVMVTAARIRKQKKEVASKAAAKRARSNGRGK